MRTLLHEGGHAFHALATRASRWPRIANAPIEFCEVASMSMELLGNEFSSVFYTPAGRRSRLPASTWKGSS